jgi:hypothetical protein
MADKLKTPQNSSWWGGSSGKPPVSKGLIILPFGININVIPEHWEKTFETVNDNLTAEMYLYHQLNELCFFRI